MDKKILKSKIDTNTRVKKGTREEKNVQNISN